VLGVIENVMVLEYAVDMKSYMSVGSTDDCQLFQLDLERLQALFRNK
jgi:hypothetical protein